MRLLARIWLVLFCGVVTGLVPAVAQITEIQAPASQLQPNLINFPTKTMGGQQFWTDVHFEGGWHIQRNPVTEHYRLLDPRDVRHAWGTLEQCKSVLNILREQGRFVPYRGRLVILLHGLNRTHSSMDLLANKLQSEYGFQTINFQYASSRETVQEHAKNLACVIDGLGPDVTEIHFVAHSLGNLVVRSYLHQKQNLTEGQATDPRLTRMVMLGPPNQGSQLARLLKNNLAFHAVAGVSGQQLSQHWDQLAGELAVPHFPFAIIAGGADQGNFYERTVFNGPSDLVVAVPETQLPGAAVHVKLPVVHTFMMEDPQVMQFIADFLSTGAVSSR